MPTASARKVRVPPQLPDREWLTPNEVARAFGMARTTLFQRMALGRLKLVVDQRGDLTFISRESVEAALKSA